MPEQYLSELRQFAPAVINTCSNAYQGAVADSDFLRLNAAEFAQCPDISIDHAVMERSSNAVVVPLAVGWNDIGSWASIADSANVDSSDNVTVGDVVTLNSKNNYLHSEGRLLATIGIENLVVVETSDAVLVSGRDKVGQIKMMVDVLRNEGRPEAVEHCRVHRPWGKSDVIAKGNGYQVKRLTLEVGAKLSTQKHYQRAEHWIVVSGVASVVRGDEELTLAENQSIHIPLGVVHSLENISSKLLEVIEVQSGAYLGEDDIVRLDDPYNRGSLS